MTEVWYNVSLKPIDISMETINQKKIQSVKHEFARTRCDMKKLIPVPYSGYFAWQVKYSRIKLCMFDLG